jgi:NitT/TauT family transport system permease protein
MRSNLWPVAVSKADKARASRKRAPPIFGMQSLFSTKIYVAVSVCAFIIVFALWVAVAHFTLVQPIFLPSPVSVFKRLAALARDGTLWGDVSSSLYRIMVGFVCASVGALFIGILMGAYRFWEAAIEPFIDFIRYMPVVAFVPLTILWTGTTDIQKFLIIWIGTFFQQALMFMDNIKRVPPDFIGLGRTLGMSDRRILLRIVVPAALPDIWDTLRISLGWAWTWVVLAELVAADSGIGYRITVAQRYFQTDTAIGYIVVLGVLGLTTDQIMKVLRRILFKYAGQS